MAALFTLVACGSDESKSADSELSDTEAELGAAAASNAEARAAAQACFETYETCKADANADEQACRDALKACLPSAPPRPSRCDGDDDAGAPVDDDAGSTPEADAGAASDDAGSKRRGHGGDRGGRGGRGGHGPGGHCGAPRIPHGFGACKEQALDQDAGMSGAEDTFRSCIAQTLEEHLTKLCQKASELCADPAAPAELCQRIGDKCSAILTPGTTPDAGP